MNGQLIIDNWTDHPPTENTAGMTLTAGQRYDVRMEYYNAFGGAVARLSWTVPGGAKQVIPADRLFPAGSTAPTPTAVSYEAESPANTWAGGAFAAPRSTASGGAIVGFPAGGGGSLTYNGINVPAAGRHRITVFYISGENRTGFLAVNGAGGAAINFTNSASWATVGSLSLTVDLQAGANTLRFFNDPAPLSDLDRITVEAAP